MNDVCYDFGPYKQLVESNKMYQPKSAVWPVKYWQKGKGNKRTIDHLGKVA